MCFGRNLEFPVACTCGLVKRGECSNYSVSTKKIQSLRETLRAIALQSARITAIKMGIERLFESRMLPNPQPYCADLSDPRRQNRNRLHALRDIIMINLYGKPPSPSGRVIPGYYNLPDRGQRLDRMLAQGHAWSTGNSESLQLDDRTDCAARVLQPLLPTLRQQVTDPRQQQWLERLAHWQGNYPQDSLEATLFNQFFYELARATLHDELGNALFDNLLGGRVLDTAMPKLVADERSPGWDNRDTPAREGRAETVLNAW